MPAKCGTLIKLEMVQKFPLHMCYRQWNASYTDLLSYFNILALENRRLCLHHVLFYFNTFVPLLCTHHKESFQAKKQIIVGSPSSRVSAPAGIAPEWTVAQC